MQPEFAETETARFSSLGGMETLADRITYIRTEMGLTQDEFAAAVSAELVAAGQEKGVSRGAVAGWETGKGMSPKNLRAVADIAETSMDWLSDNRGAPPSKADLVRRGRAVLAAVVPLELAGSGAFPETVKVFGQAAGSNLDQGALLLMDQEPIGVVPLLPGLVGMRDVYALEVTGESMIPMFNPKDPVYVSPHAPIRVDDPVIILQEPPEGGNPTAYIKLFVGQTKKDGVKARQLNLPQDMAFPSATAVHKVLSMKEALGYSGVQIDPQLAPPLRWKRRGPRA